MRFKDIPRFIQSGNYNADYPLNHLVDYIEEEIETQGLQLNPDFQRGNVWTEQQQIAYLEFLLSRWKNSSHYISKQTRLAL